MYILPITNASTCFFFADGACFLPCSAQVLVNYFSGLRSPFLWGHPRVKYRGIYKTICTNSYIHLVVRLGPKTGNTKSSKNTPHEPCHWSETHSTCFTRISPRASTSCLRCLASNCIFFYQTAVFHTSPFVPYMNADVRTPSTLHIPYNATPGTHVSACFAAAARSSCIVGQIEPTSVSDAADALTRCRLWPWCRWCPCMCRMYASRRRSVGRYECCSYGVVWGVKSGEGSPVPRHSYGGE